MHLLKNVFIIKGTKIDLNYITGVYKNNITDVHNLYTEPLRAMQIVKFSFYLFITG